MEPNKINLSEEDHSDASEGEKEEQMHPIWDWLWLKKTKSHCLTRIEPREQWLA